MKYDISLIICVAEDIRIKKMLDSIKEYCEVIVILNGATLEIKKIVEKYLNSKKFKLKILELSERNLSKSRNIGTLNSTFDKVVYYDSDCVMTENALSLYNEMLEKYQLVDGKVLFRKDTFQSSIISVMRSMGLIGYALCPSMGINKKIIKKIKYYFDEDIKWIEDAELNTRAMKKNIKVGVIEELTCIHDNLTFKQDLKSAYRYGTGVKIAAMKNLHKKRPSANWNLVIPCFKINILSGFYSVLWNFIYTLGYYFTVYKAGEK